MKIYWHWSDVPELAGLSRAQRRQVVRNCFFQTGFGLWQFWLGQSAIFLCSVVGTTVGFALEDVFDFPVSVTVACGLAGVLIGCTVYGWIYYAIIVEELRPCFRDYLQTHPVDPSADPKPDATPHGNPHHASQPNPHL